jgi:vacuolar-type H+-ATPase subunit C/Vma6
MAKITCGSGASFQLKNVWYKLYYEETRETTNTEATEDERKVLWNIVNSQVDNQITELTGGNQN